MEKTDEDLVVELFEENDDLERYGFFFTIIFF